MCVNVLGPIFKVKKNLRDITAFKIKLNVAP